MGYFDRADCLKSYYEIDRKARKWSHPIFFHFMDVAVVNSMVIYKMLDEVHTMNMKQAKISLCTSLVGVAGIESRNPASSDVSRKNSKRKRIIPQGIRTSKAKHTPAIGQTYRRCNHCSTKAHRTKWICSTCDVPLCHLCCFSQMR